MSIRCAWFGHDIQFPSNNWEPITCGRCGQMLSVTIESWLEPKRKEPEVMSTKQRGDVEKIGGTVMFGVHINSIGNRVDFTRDEFRRIWEAGQKEFANFNSQASFLAKKDAEIARLRGWLEKIRKHEINACDCCNDGASGETTAWLWAGRALSGEKVPE